MQDLNIVLCQTNIRWEEPAENRAFGDRLLNSLSAPVDLIVFPEMFATGFSMNTAFAEAESGPTLAWMQAAAARINGVLCGSVMVQEQGRYFNRLYWVQPDGTYEKYDKKHLFRFGGEPEQYTSGGGRLIVELKGWRICPLICYDLRFPVWARNRYHENRFEYDVLLYTANWPARRTHHWESLLLARAIENLSYCVGLNRVGCDGNGLDHAGHSRVCDPTGKIYQPLESGAEGLIQTTLSAQGLLDWRSKFNTGPDWDPFTLEGV